MAAERWPDLVDFPLLIVWSCSVAYWPGGAQSACFT